MSQIGFFATAPKGIEPLLAEEIRVLGGRKIAQGRGGVRFEGRLQEGYRICLWSRVANRLLMPLARFPAPTPEALYEGVKALPWEEHLAPEGSLAVDFSTALSAIGHSHYGALKVKDAIVDRFRERQGVRPSVDTARPDLRVNLYLYKDEATLSLDLSGESLHRRGYREEGVAAPLKENLAAAILLRAGWPEMAARGAPLLDPMCGSGTLPIEAALMAADVAPGLQRTRFGFLRWPQHRRELWTDLLDEAIERRERGLAALPPIAGYDIDPRAVRAALSNVARADLAGRIRIEQRPLGEAAPIGGGVGLLVVNPPYGERIGAASGLPELYAQLGELLRERFEGWQAAVFSGNPSLAHAVGLRSRTTYTLFNGPIECKLFNFDVEPEQFIAPKPLRGPQPERERDLRPWEGPLGEAARGFENRLQKNLKHLGRWARREAIDCWRLYDADLPDYAFAIDIYRSDELYVHVQEYEAPAGIDPDKADQRAREALAIIPGVAGVPPERMVFKVRRRQKGAAQYQKMGSDSGFHEVREGSCRLLVNLGDYLDTGLFLDHRITRGMIGEMARGKRFLNLFAYTGSVTVHAALGGAKATTSVDMSATYLEWARRNLELNGIRSGAEHRLIQADCLAWLEEIRERGGEVYDLIFLDPPTFSNSKRMDGNFDVQRDHVALLRGCMDLLAPGGTLIFSTNFRRFRLDGEALADLVVEEISRATLPPDFQRNPRIHFCFRIGHRK